MMMIKVVNGFTVVAIIIIIVVVIIIIIIIIITKIRSKVSKYIKTEEKEL
jgi:hypothetical protein